MCSVGADLRGEALEVLVEDLRAPEGHQRRRVGRHAHGQAHRAPGRPSDRDDAPGERGNSFPSVALEREPEMILAVEALLLQDRKSTRLNSSHGYSSYAVFCLKKKKCQH